VLAIATIVACASRVPAAGAEEAATLPANVVPAQA
jgi:hypothetical protein